MALRRTTPALLALLWALTVSPAPAQDEGLDLDTDALGLEPESGPSRDDLSELERERLIIRAEEGEAISQLRLARYYQAGARGFPRDRQEAYRWHRAAAKNGELEAQVQVAAMYLTGTGVRRSPTHAFTWFKRAAERGHAEAAKALGEMYYQGVGTEQDHDAAYTWFRQSAEAGDPLAQLRVGRMHREGQGTRESDFQAYLWLNLAAMAKGDLAETAAAERDELEEDFSEAEELGAKLVSREYEQLYADPALRRAQEEERDREEQPGPPGVEMTSDPIDLPGPEIEEPEEGGAGGEGEGESAGGDD
ncbi:MAG: tetratricopeptide repeat protein [Thiohalospira sp.]